MRSWCVAAALLVTLVPHALAGTPEAPELTDPAGDATLEGVPTPWGEHSDLLAAWLTDDAEGLHVHLRVADLEALVAVPGVPGEDAMFLLRFRPEHQSPGEAASRDGDWTVRSDFQPGAASPWSHWLERPCMDGKDSDGCAGGDRDIIDGLSGSVDLAASTVSVVVPWDLLEGPRAGDGVGSLTASTHFVYPAWPAYTSDWDTDQKATRYLYQSFPSGQPPAPEAGEEAAGEGPVEAPAPAAQSNGTSSVAAGEEPRPQPVQPKATATQEAGAVVRESPAAFVAAVAALALVALARRLSSK